MFRAVQAKVGRRPGTRTAGHGHPRPSGPRAYFEGDGQDGLERLARALDRKITIQPNLGRARRLRGQAARRRAAVTALMAKPRASRMSQARMVGDLRLAAKAGDRTALSLALDQMRTLAHSPAVLGAVPGAAVQSARPPRRPARHQAGGPHRLPEGMEAPEASAGEAKAGRKGVKTSRGARRRTPTAEQPSLFEV